MENLKNRFVLSSAYCLHNGVVILMQNEDCVTIGLLNFTDEGLKDRLSRAVRNSSGKASAYVKMEKDEFKQKLTLAFSKNDQDVMADNKNDNSAYDENAAKILLESLIEKACACNATDVHIEEECVRFRVGGKLINEITVDDENLSFLVQRIKLISKLNVVEKRKGQDGQFIYKQNGRCVFVRVSCLPVAIHGDGALRESVVLRLLDPLRVVLNIENLGFDKLQINLLRNVCTLPSGLVLICGPTGSGKSTTAGALLEEIKNTSNNQKKIISLEDPPEYVLPGITQVQISEEGERTFEEGLRRIFRHDPDVIMIGEIRDEVTCKVSVQAALTGHLVIATVHAGSFVQARLRLCNLGQDNKIINEVLRCIIVQRLINGKLQADIDYAA